MLGTIDWSVLVKLQYLAFYLAVPPVFCLFLRLIFPEFPELLVRTVVVLCGLFPAVVVFTPVRIFSHTLTPFEVATLGLIAHTWSGRSPRWQDTGSRPPSSCSG